MRNERVPVRIKQLLRDLSDREAEVKEIDTFLQVQEGKVLRLVYENLTDVSGVLGFALQDSGCKALPPLQSLQSQALKPQLPSFQKLHTGSLSNLVENWKEVEAALRQTRWAWMLQN